MFLGAFLFSFKKIWQIRLRKANTCRVEQCALRFSFPYFLVASVIEISDQQNSLLGSGVSSTSSFNGTAGAQLRVEALFFTMSAFYNGFQRMQFRACCHGNWSYLFSSFLWCAIKGTTPKRLPKERPRNV